MEGAVYGVIFGIVAVIVLIVIIIKVVVPKVKDKKYKKRCEEERIAQEQARIRLEEKKKRLDGFWINNRAKIHTALKKVFYPELVDKWENISDMLSYEIKDTCPVCGEKLRREFESYSSTSTVQRSIDGYTSYGAPAKFVYNTEAFDGGHFEKTALYCDTYPTCRKKLVEICVQYDRNNEKINRIFKREAIDWRKPEVEAVLGKELCDYIDSNGVFRSKNDFVDYKLHPEAK